jgi:hypothetical protein
MAERFESEHDLLRERRAIELFASLYKYTYKKLDPNDIDYKLFNADGMLIAYVEVKGRHRNIKDAYPLPIAARKLVKLFDKRLTGIVIWACDDGIIYAKAEKLRGQSCYSGRLERVGSVNDNELMIYHDRQDDLRYCKYS